MPDYTPYQKGIIKRFYEHRDTLALQKLSEIVSNLYLETDPKKIDRSWKSVHTQLINAGCQKKYAQTIVEGRDLEELAKVIGELT
ncbi:MAG: hypothetical protein RL885_30400 [Planctomycetota bacterium]